MGDSREISFTIRAKDAATAALKQVQGSLTGMLSSFKNIGSLVAGFSFAAVIKDIIDLGTASDTTFRQIAANLPTFTDGIDDLRKSMESLATESGRSREELQGAAVEISRLGVADTHELQQRLEAATDFADVTGASVNEVVDSLDQLMDGFNVSADDARDALVKLSAAARQSGVDTRSILETLPRITQRAQELGLTFDETTRAIIHFANEGHEARAMLKDFNGNNAQGLRFFADQAIVAAGATKDFDKRLEEVRGSIQRTNEKIKSELSATLSELGTKTIPSLQKGFTELLKQINATIDAGSRMPGGLADVRAFANATHRNDQGPPTPPAERPVVTYTPIGQPLPGPPTTAKPPSIEELDAAIDKTGEAAKRATEAANAALERWRKGVIDTKQAWSELNGVIADLSDDILVQFDAHTKQTLDGLNEQINKVVDPDEKTRLASQLAILTSRFDQMRVVVALTRDTVKQLDDDSHNLNDGTIQSFFEDWGSQAERIHQQMEKASDPAVKAKWKELLDLIVGRLREAGKEVDGLADPKPIAASNGFLKQLGGQWDSISRSIIAAGQAFGGFSDSTAAALQNIVSLGEGITKLVASGGTDVSAWVSTITSALAIGGKLFGGGGPNGQERLQAASQQLGIKQLLVGIQHQLTGEDSLSAQLESLDLEFEGYRQQVEQQLAGKRNEAERESTLAKINAYYSQRVQQVKDDFASSQTQSADAATAAKQAVSSAAVQGITTVQADRMVGYSRSTVALLTSIDSKLGTIVSRGGMGAAASSAAAPNDPSLRRINQQLGSAVIAEQTRRGDITISPARTGS